MYDSTKPYKENVLRIIAKTWPEGYAPHSSTDGIGTKGVYHWQHRTFRNAVLDFLGMNLNDLLVMRCIPRELHDHIIIPEEDDKAVYEILEALSEECIKRSIIIDSGETSVHSNLNGLEIGGTIVGERVSYRPNRLCRNDLLVGCRSNGLHSNGFTKVRELFGDGFREEFIEPTRIYDELFPVASKFDINGLVHITGGAYTKLKDFLDENDTAAISFPFQPQKIFTDIYNLGVSDYEMYKTFNCGIGFILSADEGTAGDIAHCLNEGGLESFLIGRVIPGRRNVQIDSAFSGRRVIL